MANVNRMQELVQRIEADAALRAELEQAPSRDAKREVLDRHGFGDITPAAAQAYVRQTIPELSDEALDQIAGGLSESDANWIGFGVGAAVSAGGLMTVAAAAG